MSMYSYVEGNPLGYVDPLGLVRSNSLGQRNWIELFVHALRSPFAAWDGRHADGYAKEAQHATALKGSSDGPADAFRHCVWSCHLTQQVGAENSEIITDTHEEVGRQYVVDWPAEYQDIANNAVGRQCALDRGRSCPDSCMKKLTTGGLFDLGGKNPMNVDEWNRKNGF